MHGLLMNEPKQDEFEGKGGGCAGHGLLYTHFMSICWDQGEYSGDGELALWIKCLPYGIRPENPPPLFSGDLTQNSQSGEPVHITLGGFVILESQ